MKTVITINHANRKGLMRALSLIQAELSQGFTESSGKVPATQSEVNISQPLPVGAYPPGCAPIPALTAQPKRREEDQPAPEELDDTSYRYQVED